MPQSSRPPAPLKRPAGVDNPNGNPNAALNPPAVRNTDSCVPLHRTGEVVHNYNCDGPAPGSISFRWICGSRIAALNRDPRIQVVAYNEDTYILRENPCIHWEAPFTYLLFGNTGALLIDTGATPEAAYYPLRETVDRIVRRWCDIRGKKTIPLTVVLTSREDIAQNQGLGQFVGRPGTTLAPTRLDEMKRFYKLDSTWPSGTGRIDLGGRVIEVIPTPGTHKDGVTFYDNYNDLLHTGDLLYAGRVQVANDRDYVASLTRLKDWAATRAVKWVMGGHIDMMFVPGRAYPRFATFRPYEHVLQLDPALIDEALLHASRLAGQPGVAIRAEFALLNRVSPDEGVYRVSPEMPNIPVPTWLP